MNSLLAAIPSELQPHGPWQWVLAILSIVLIDVVLAGDNAVVIALAVRRLGRKERLLGISVGAGVAVVLRIALTAVASRLLAIPLLKLIGGTLILWIAIKLLLDNTGDEQGMKEARNLWHAIWLITLADVTMSLDNVLAVAGASGGNLSLLIFGLVLSIPLVVFTSNLLARAMDRYPAIIYAGSAILGFLGGGMIVSDPWLAPHLPSAHWFLRAMQCIGAVAVLASPRLFALVRKNKTP